MGQYDGTAGWIERVLGRYLDGNPVKNLMTPGEYTEWSVDLKARQVVIAEAWSEAFDPALEIVDDKGKVLASNDDRFPGDQRPVLFWRCEKDGAYAIRARCFNDKFGGLFQFRSSVYQSVDAVEGGTVDVEVGAGERFLVRVPMKAGEMRRLAVEHPRGYLDAFFQQAISPLGLPDIELSAPLNPVTGNAVYASVAGSYYVVCVPRGNNPGKIRVKTAKQEIVPMAASGGVRSGQAATNAAAVWTLSAKAGELLQVTTPNLSLSSAFILDELPDIADFDLKDHKKNPFFPREPKAQDGPAFSELPGRARDPRLRVFYVNRDCELWLACNGSGPNDAQYAVTVRPAPASFVAAEANTGSLRVGNTDYWAFDAKAGDVMTFKAKFSGFAQRLVVRDPDLREVWNATAQPDQDEFGWNMVARKPGRYLVAVSALGDGGGGTYTLDRQVFEARTFDKETPAMGDFSTGSTEIWKFTARPGEPLYIRLTSADRSYTLSSMNEEGASMGLPLTQVDDANQFGVLSVREPTTFVLVFVARGEGGKYRVELSDLPGYLRPQRSSGDRHF